MSPLFTFPEKIEKPFFVEELPKWSQRSRKANIGKSKKTQSSHWSTVPFFLPIEFLSSMKIFFGRWRLWIHLPIFFEFTPKILLIFGAKIQIFKKNRILNQFLFVIFVLIKPLSRVPCGKTIAESSLTKWGGLTLSPLITAAAAAKVI